MVLIFLSGLIAWPLAKFSGTSKQAFLPCAMFTNVGPIGIPLVALAYGPEGMAPAVVLLVISNILHFTLGAGVMSGNIADKFQVEPHKVASTVIVGHLLSMAFLPLGIWLAFF